MAEMRPIGRSTSPPGHVLGRKLDSIPFSRYHMMLIAVLSLVGFVDGYDLVMTGSLLVLASTRHNRIARPEILDASRIEWNRLRTGVLCFMCRS